jgi:hypothetical protein
MCGELESRTGRIYAVLIATADADPSRTRPCYASFFPTS